MLCTYIGWYICPFDYFSSIVYHIGLSMYLGLPLYITRRSFYGLATTRKERLPQVHMLPMTDFMNVHASALPRVAFLFSATCTHALLLLMSYSGTRSLVVLFLLDLRMFMLHPVHY